VCDRYVQKPEPHRSTDVSDEVARLTANLEPDKSRHTLLVVILPLVVTLGASLGIAELTLLADLRERVLANRVPGRGLLQRPRCRSCFHL